MNYKEKVLQGTSWRRAARVVLENPVDMQGKAAVFFEEIATQFDDGVMNNKPVGQVRETYADPAERFQVVNPADDTPIAGKTASYLELYQLVHSLYLHVVGKRDAADAAAEDAAALEASQAK